MFTVNTLTTPNLILRPIQLEDKQYIADLQSSHGYREDSDMENLSLLFVAPTCGWVIEDQQYRIPLGTIYYGFSLFHCMTQSLAQGGPGLGTCMGPKRTMNLLRNVGFADVMELPIKSQTNMFFVGRA